MACQTPVVYANNSSLPEVAAAGGIAVPAEDLEAIQAAMITLLTDDEKQKEFSVAPPAAPGFTFQFVRALIIH